MTTDTESNAQVPADNTEQEPVQKDRDIQDLLKLDTYQGMTDGEIQKVIDWYVKLAHSDEESNAYRTAAQTMTESHEEAVAAILADSEKTLKTIVENSTLYQEVTPQAVTSLLVEKGEV